MPRTRARGERMRARRVLEYVETGLALCGILSMLAGVIDAETAYEWCVTEPCSIADEEARRRCASMAGERTLPYFAAAWLLIITVIIIHVYIHYHYRAKVRA